MKNPPKRRIRKCYLCPSVVRELQMHKMFYTGPDNDMKSEIAPAPQVTVKEVYICHRCFRDAGYWLKKGEEELDIQTIGAPTLLTEKDITRPFLYSMRREFVASHTDDEMKAMEDDGVEDGTTPTIKEITES